MTPLPNPDHNDPAPRAGRGVTPPGPARARELSAWLRLNLTHGLGPAGTLTLLRALGTPEQVLSARHSQVSAVVGAALATRLLSPDDEVDRDIERAMSWAALPGNHLLTLADPAYPSRLLQIADPPPLLYVRGCPEVLSDPGIGIVGSRHATRGGLHNAGAFATSLAGHGLTITSGLARGIDTAAHEATLQAGGQTIAVMGTGIDRIYPAANRRLADAIAAQGALLTEFAPGTAALRGNFPRRNRLIAGLSVGILVVEAARHSGSLITARQAVEFDREVFAIPGSIHSPVSRGCHQLIRDGAKLVESADDVLSELQALLPPDRPRLASPVIDKQRKPVQSDPRQGDLLCDDDTGLLARIDWEPITIDALLPDNAGAETASRLAQQLLELELSGQIERLADGRIRRLPG